jgi:hypothetical protein
MDLRNCPALTLWRRPGLCDGNVQARPGLFKTKSLNQQSIKGGLVSGMKDEDSDIDCEIEGRSRQRSANPKEGA